MTFGNTVNKEQGEKKAAPVHSEKVGGIKVSTWENKSKEGASFYTVSIQRSYKDGNDWKNTDSYRINDLPKVILALQKTYEKAVVSENSE